MLLVAAAIPLLAHQGGWDEVLLVGGPILVIIGILAVARHRVEAQAEREDARSDR
jgi:hypothetical protein